MARKKQHGIRSTAVVKWNCNSKDGKKLKKLLEGGVITASMSPKVIREMFPQFQKYGDQSFRSALSRMKTLTGFNTRGFGANNDDDVSVLDADDISDDDDDEEEDSPMCGVTVTSVQNNQNASVGTGVKNVTSQAGAELIRNEEETWLPLFIMAVYRDEDMVWHVVAVIVLPSGVGFKNTNDVAVRTEKGATELVISVTWPSFVVNIKELHALFDDSIKHTDDFIVRKRALMTRMAQMRPTAQDPLKSTARIPLPFQVEANIPDDSWDFIGSPTGTRVLYMDLKAPSSNTYKGATVKDAKILETSSDTKEN